jgi:hypothetical protein
MSIQETIARLTGKLVFDVDSRGLQQFNAMMQRAATQMGKVGQEYDKLATKLNTKLKLNVDTSGMDKAKAKLDAATSRQLRSEKALQSAKRDTFQAELSQQKLKYTGEKQQANLVSQTVKDAQNAAVIAAKAHNAQQAANGTTKQQVASQGQLVALQQKQARLQLIHAKVAAIQSKADAQHLLSQSKTQQIQNVAARIAQQQQHQAVVHQARMASLAAAANAKQTTANNQQQKFQWAQQKHAVWQANQAARAAKASSGGGFSGMSGMLHGGIGGIGMGIAEALGPVGLALAGVTAAMYVLSERVDKRQESTADTQQFENALDNSSDDPKTREKFRAAYVGDYQEYGMSINRDSARTYSNSVAGLGKMGYSPEAAMKVMKDRSALFRAGNLNATQQESLNYQMGQVLAKGYASGTDYKPIEDALGPRLAGDVDIGASRQLGYKGNEKGAKAFMLKARSERRITPQSLDAGFAYAVSQNHEALERHKDSIDARQARFENDKYLQTANQQKDPELIGAINDRIAAERELTKAMEPVNKLFEELDVALTKFEASLIRSAIGKNADGTEKTPVQVAQGLATAGGADGNITLPNKYNAPTEQQLLDANAADPVHKVLQFFGLAGDAKAVADENRSRWRGVEATGRSDIWKKQLGLDQASLPGFLPQLQLNMDNFQKQQDAFNRVQEASKANSLTSQQPIGATGPTSTITTNAPVINIEGPKIDIQLHGKATEEDSAQVMSKVTEELDKREAQLPAIINRELGNIISSERSTQSQVRQ